VHAQLKLLADLPRPQQGKPISFERTIELDNITFRYSSTERRAVKGVSLEIPKGATVGFIGSSGSGKSTLVDILLGLLSPESGAVKVDGVDIQKNLRSWQDKIGYVPQSIYLTDDTLRRNIAFGLPNEGIDEEAVQRAVRASQLDQFINELPEGLDTVVGERGVRLSGGQRQRIGIARALYHDPAVLVLDEATSALDVATESGVMAAIRNLRHEKTIIIVAHRLSTVEYCDRLYRFSDGRIVKEGSANEVLSDPSLQSGPKAAPTRIIGATN
jgi:ABC-type multidrug transport system fused ATPase/permease subunit